MKQWPSDGQLIYSSYLYLFVYRLELRLHPLVLIHQPVPAGQDQRGSLDLLAVGGAQSCSSSSLESPSGDHHDVCVARVRGRSSGCPGLCGRCQGQVFWVPRSMWQV